MRKIIFGFLLSFCMLTSNVQAEELKIAVFDYNKIAMESDAYKQGVEALTNNFASKKKELDALETSLIELGKKAQSSNNKELLEKYQKSKEEFLQKNNEYLRNLQESNLKLQERLDEVFVAAAKELAESKGYSLVVDKSTVYYFKKDMDVTLEMKELVNKLWVNFFK